MNEIELVNKMQKMWNESNSAFQTELTKTAESYGFYTGDDQWEQATKAELLHEDKPALTLNLILSVINLLVGMETSNKQDFIIYPRKGGYRLVSEILTRLLKHTMDISDGNFEQSIAFLDGAIGSKGWLKVDIVHQVNGFLDPFNGQIEITRKSPFDIREDPNATRYDLNGGGKYIIELYWLDKEQSIALYPKKRKILEKDLESVSGDDVIDFYGRPVDKNTVSDPSYYKYRLKDTWWMSWEKRDVLIDKINLQFHIVNPSQEDLLKVILQKDRELAREEERPERYKTIEMPIKMLNLTTTIGDILLENMVDPFNGISRFPLTRFAPYWADGQCLGVVENLKDPQREFNKRRSQILHILNQTANSGYFVPREAAVDTDKLEKEGAAAGTIIEYSGGKQHQPEKIAPNVIPVGHLTAAQLNKQDIQDISGLNPDLTQFSGDEANKGQSGIAIQRKQQMGMLVSQPIFNNYNKFIREFGLTLMEFIRKGNVYTAEEVVEIIEDSEMENISPQQILAAISSWKVGQYGCKLEIKPTSPTIRLANFDQLMAIATNVGLPIPIEILMEYTDIPNKEKAIKLFKQQQSIQQQIEMMKLTMQMKGSSGGGSAPNPRGTPSPPKPSSVSKNM